MDELLVTLKMLEIEYINFNDDILIGCITINKEVILSIVDYLKLHKFKWTYIYSCNYIPALYYNYLNDYDYNGNITDIFIRHEGVI